MASIPFQVDSALECLTFALNALGWAAMPSGFWDVTDGRALRCISPLDILGTPRRDPKPGYTTIFPSLQTLWQSQGRLIGQIRDLHDVSKHRQTIYVGGQRRLDTPVGFYESLGIAEESSNRAGAILLTLLCPEAENHPETRPSSPFTSKLGPGGWAT